MPQVTSSGLNKKVQGYWEGDNGYGPCGTDKNVVQDIPLHSKEWFQAVEKHRYEVEPYIHSFAQFTLHKGKKLLEIGVGAGTDHLQWARAGAITHGVDLTSAAINTASKHLAHHGLTSDLQQADAEKLPFQDNFFDIVYSWGVIHHSEDPDKIVNEVGRVLNRENGQFIGMFYHRPSLVTLRLWIGRGLLKGKPFRSFKNILYHEMESIGTQGYTMKELRSMFLNNGFKNVEIEPILTIYDTPFIPHWLTRFIPQRFGWFLAIKAFK